MVDIQAEISEEEEVLIKKQDKTSVMAVLPNIGGALCSMPQSLPCSNAAKTRNTLKFAGVPQTRQQI